MQDNPTGNFFANCFLEASCSGLSQRRIGFGLSWIPTEITAQELEFWRVPLPESQSVDSALGSDQLANQTVDWRRQ